MVPKHETISRAKNQRFESASLFIEKMVLLYLKDLIVKNTIVGNMKKSVDFKMNGFKQ